MHEYIKALFSNGNEIRELVSYLPGLFMLEGEELTLGQLRSLGWRPLTRGAFFEKQSLYTGA